MDKRTISITKYLDTLSKDDRIAFMDMTRAAMEEGVTTKEYHDRVQRFRQAHDVRKEVK